MVAEHVWSLLSIFVCCSLAKISMVAERTHYKWQRCHGCSLAKISMVAELDYKRNVQLVGCSLAKISMVAELNI